KLSRPGLAIRVLAQPRNGGKARALNRGLAETTQELVVTVDGDSYLRPDALRKIVQRYLSDPPRTVAVAGAVLVSQSRASWPAAGPNASARTSCSRGRCWRPARASATARTPACSPGCRPGCASSHASASAGRAA